MRVDSSEEHPRSFESDDFEESSNSLMETADWTLLGIRYNALDYI